MIVTMKENSLVVERAGSPKIYSESQLLHNIKVELITQGHDVIKKLMWKDGHMTSDTQHYIRERKGEFAIWDGNYQIRLANEAFNSGEVIYNVERN